AARRDIETRKVPGAGAGAAIDDDGHRAAVDRDGRRSAVESDARDGSACSGSAVVCGVALSDQDTVVGDARDLVSAGTTTPETLAPVALASTLMRRPYKPPVIVFRAALKLVTDFPEAMEPIEMP
ncbi:unnamed protein product, partial [Mycena citricolor]